MTDTAGSARFSFSPFASHQFFTDVNRWLVDRVVRPAAEVVVDLGCGPGAVTKLILERIGVTPGARVIGVDPSASALERARADVPDRRVEFCEGTAECLSRLVPRADAVLFLNAIHLVPDKPPVLAEIRKVLPPAGRFAFNTTFFTGAYWVVRAMQWLKERGIAVHANRAGAMQWLTPEEYASLCEAAGFRLTTVERLRIELPPAAFADIGRFSLFIEGALPGVPLEQGSEALQVGLARALDEMPFAALPRYWLEVIAEAV
jgi:ubiquinone/menaquinone biosynthesis C-methylase UbiE